MIKLLFDRELGKANLRNAHNRLSEKLIFCEEFNIETLIPLPDIRCTFSLCISNDGNYLAAMHGNHSISVIDVRINKLTHTLVGHPRSVWCGSFHPVDSSQLVTGCLGGYLIIWKLTYGKKPSYEQRNYFKVAETTAISSIVFHNSGRLFLFSSNCSIYIWRNFESQPRVCNNFITKIKYLHLLPDSYYIIVGHDLPFRMDYTNLLSELRHKLFDIREEMRDFIFPLFRSTVLNWESSHPVLNLMELVDENRPHFNAHDLSKLPRNAADIIASVKSQLCLTLRFITAYLNTLKSKYRSIDHVEYYDDQPNMYLLVGIASRQYEDLLIEEDHLVLLNYIADVLYKVNRAITFDSEPIIGEPLKMTFSMVFNQLAAINYLRVCYFLNQFPPEDDYLKIAELIVISHIFEALLPVMLYYIQIYWETAINQTGFYSPRANSMRALIQIDHSTYFQKLAQIKAFVFDPLKQFEILTDFEFYHTQDTVVPVCIVSNTASVAASDRNGLRFVAAILFHRVIGVYGLNDNTFGRLMYTFPVDYTSTIALALSPLHNHLVVACRRRKSSDGNSIFLFKLGFDHFIAHDITKFKAKINCMVFLKNLKDGIAIGLNGGDGIFRRNRVL